MNKYSEQCANTCYGCQSLGLRMVELQGQLEEMTKRAENAEESLAAMDVVNRHLNDQIKEAELELNNLENFALQQKIDVLEDLQANEKTTFRMHNGNMRCAVFCIDIAMVIHQLRAQLDGGL